MTTATRRSAFVLLASLLLTGCASSSWPDGWSREDDLSGSGYWLGFEGGTERYYSGEHPTESPIIRIPPDPRRDWSGYRP